MKGKAGVVLESKGHEGRSALIRQRTIKFARLRQSLLLVVVLEPAVSHLLIKLHES